ncbi:LytTR family transcriptional regulator DNA-binding domain-containing protein [Bacteroides thetaiotaomicron]|uniref:LytTR family transcriptional regulator DNA-binding domain-containing protein n=1 Tax=Bacteroides thetaiotaomicron TaxID=818 RepID=UPI00293D305C|nr:LytTR family transcriptional regulator DNA-binding domain-containing protein [Bacteroides thetaiotaomicron]MCA6020586.1 LytTR family transcriptional regulator DNA-binding domain-containing protein [Bacteroides thetaiotaomicron]
MGYSADIAKDQNKIFLSTTMTGNLQLLRLEHISYFRYNSRSNQWEAVLCNQHTLMLKRSTNSQKILSYHPCFIQVNQSFIVNVSYLDQIRDKRCVLLPPFDGMETLRISTPFMRKLKEKYPSI